MGLRRLGKSGLNVSAVGLGLADFAASETRLARLLFAPLDQGAKTRIIDTALAAGINWFDTAEMYGFGTSERSLASALCALGVEPARVVVASKWFPLLRTAASIVRTFGERQQALAPYPVGLYMVHHPYGFSTVATEMKAMAALATQGKIRAVGVSNFDAKAMRKAHLTLRRFGLPLVANEIRYNLLNRDIEKNGVLETARELEVSLIAYSPLAKGLLSGRFHQHPELLATQGLRRRLMMPQDLSRSAPLMHALGEIAGRQHVSIAQVALAWVLQRHGEILLAVVGATKPWQAEAAGAAMGISLGVDALEALDERSAWALKA